MAKEARQFQQAATVVPPADLNAAAASQGEYHDLVGVIVGEDVVHNDIAIDESDVEQYDNSHPDADEQE